MSPMTEQRVGHNIAPASKHSLIAKTGPATPDLSLAPKNPLANRKVKDSRELFC
jgi:hypothetical protein